VIPTRASGTTPTSSQRKLGPFNGCGRLYCAIHLNRSVPANRDDTRDLTALYFVVTQLKHRMSASHAANGNQNEASTYWFTDDRRVDEADERQCKRTKTDK
jgi:hypothetical protein